MAIAKKKEGDKQVAHALNANVNFSLNNYRDIMTINAYIVEEYKDEKNQIKQYQPALMMMIGETRLTFLKYQSVCFVVDRIWSLLQRHAKTEYGKLVPAMLVWFFHNKMDHWFRTQLQLSIFIPPPSLAQKLNDFEEDEKLTNIIQVTILFHF